MDRRKIAEDMAQEFYGIYMNDPSNNHLENKEWVLLVEARTKAKQILALFEAAEEHTAHLVDDVIRLEEELKVGNALTAKLTDQCRELEASISEEGVKISIDSIIKRERKNEREKNLLYSHAQLKFYLKNSDDLRGDIWSFTESLGCELLGVFKEESK